MAKDIGTGTASQVFGEVINKGFVAQIRKEIDALIQKNRNNQLLQDKLERLKAHSQFISTTFDQHQNTASSENIKCCLKKMTEAIQKAIALIDAQSQSEEGSSSSKQQRFRGWMSKLLHPRDISELNAELEQLFENLDKDFSIIANARLAMVPLPSLGWLQSSASASSENIKCCLKKMTEAIKKAKALIDAQSQSEEGSSSSKPNAFIDAQSQPQEGSRYRISNAFIVAKSQVQRIGCWMSKLPHARYISELNAELDQLFEDLDKDFSIIANARWAMVPLPSLGCLQSSASAAPQETDVPAAPRPQSSETQLQIVLAEPPQSSLMPQSSETQLQIVPAMPLQSSAMPQSYETPLQIVPATPPQSSAMPQSYVTTPPPQSSASVSPQETESGFVGQAIISAETQLKTWINAETPEVRVIAVYGMPGVGKTTLLERVYKFYKHTNFFDSVIRLTVSRNYEIRDLQGRIAKKINLNLSDISDRDADTPKRKLSKSLKRKNFLLILDDIWSAVNLEELGVAFGADKASKVVFSTRQRDLARDAEQFINVEPLLKHEGWELFERIAFKGGHVPEELQECARKIADECKSLPLAITVVAAVMRGKGTKVDDWKYCLSLMKKADPYFPERHPSVRKELYEKLRWSYDDLSTNVQNCFLYCAMYAEDEQIWVDELVRMWIAEGFCKSKDETYSMSMQQGYSYVNLLIDRGLFQKGNFEKQGMDRIVNKPVNMWKKRFITVHDVIRDVAIYIAEGEQEKKHLCCAGLQLQGFPDSTTQDCKRMSLRSNQIESVPEDIPCKQLVSLILSQNPLACNVGWSFLKNLTSLRVLDLSNTQIESAPTSLSQLRVLDLSSTQIKSVPTSFTQLQFLTLRNTCIEELPSEIGNLSHLQFLDISECKYLTSIPTEISKLTSLKRLHLSMGMENAVKDPKNIMALRGLKHLVELHLYMFFKFENHEIMGTIMGSWVEMRHLYLHYNHMIPSKCNLPDGMQNMKNLETLVLYDYRGTRLPNWICEFQQLHRLEMDSCGIVKELPPLERLPRLKFLKLRKYSDVRNLGIRNGFPELEILHLSDMPKLRSIGVLEEGTLPKLHVLKVKKCPLLKKLPIGMEKLPNLSALYGHRISWWDKIIWEDHNMKICLQKLFKEILMRN